MRDIITPLFSYGTIFSHIIFVFFVLAAIFHKSWGREIVVFIGKHAVVLGFLVTTAAVVGSLIYSNFIGYAPCELCWWQRIFIYPQAVIFLIALYKKDGGIFKYVVPLSILGGLVALYHTYIQLGGTSSVLPCTAVGGACTKVFVLEFGYVTIPTMSLTICLFVILLAVIKKISQKI